MATQMNFGPEWMRVGGETARRNLSFELDNQDNNNNYKYSKEYMLSLYKYVDLPANIEFHEYAVTTEGQIPLNLLQQQGESLDNNTTRTMNDHRLKFNSDKGYSFENLTGRSNLLSKGNESFGYNNNEYRRGSEVEDKPLWSGVEKDNVGTFDSNGVFHLGGGDTSLDSSLEPEKEQDHFNFDYNRDLNSAPFSIENSNKQSRINNYLGNNHSLMTNASQPQPLPPPAAATDDNSQRTYQWIYRDPSGNVQGPFSSIEMQQWFEAGFFDQSLIVKREDAQFFEPLSVLIQKVNNADTPFLSPWSQQDAPPNKLKFQSNNLFSTESFLGNPTLDRLPHQDVDTFHTSSSLKSNMGTPQSPFGNPPFVPSPLPRVNPMNKPALSSPWENSSSSSWLGHQNDSFFNNGTRQQQQVLTSRREFETNAYSTSSSSAAAGYQQQVMNQQMEQQYLNMLRQNQQQHLQLQQRMLQQQQLILQQQRQQQQQMFMNNNAAKQTFDQPHRPPPLQPQHQARGWSSVPGTPGFVEPLQSPWNAGKFNDPFANAGLQSPRRSQSPTNIIPQKQQEHQQKTQFEHEDQLAFALYSINLAADKKPVQQEPVIVVNPIETLQQLESKPKVIDEPESINESSAWGSTTPKKKTLRQIQLEEEASSANEKTQPKSKTWSAVSAATKPVQSRPVLSPSYSTNTGQAKSANAWDTPARQKRVSMNASIPSTITAPRVASSSRHPTIKSEPKGPSEDFLKWCRLSLRGLNAGVNAEEILEMLLSFPVDSSCSEIIQDIIYANSASMDGRRFANDYITRREADLEGKLSIVLPKTMVNNATSEFKVVTKKGKKKQQL